MADARTLGVADMCEITASSDHQPAANAKRSVDPVSARKVLQGFIAHISQEVWIRREIARARALDDQVLADIGLERRDIKQAVRDGRFREASHNNSRRSSSLQISPLKFFEGGRPSPVRSSSRR